MTINNVHTKQLAVIVAGLVREGVTFKDIGLRLSEKCIIFRTWQL